QPIILRFAHPDDSAAANRHSARLDGADGVEPVLKRVRGYDLRIKIRRSVDIVIVSGDAGRLQFARFNRSDLAKGDTTFHSDLSDLADDLEHAPQFLGATAHAPTVPSPAKA